MSPYVWVSPLKKLAIHTQPSQACKKMVTEYTIANNGRPLNGENLNINQDNAVTLSVMLNNIEEKVSRLITDTDSPLHDLLKDRKVLYEQDEDIIFQEWIN
ncbi:hypothetical protein H8356DRAFT_1420547 [Neocallimastix lanati (nom. inval.)]|nr:hypothetical protein H8356DRAFT_1420547 [Neocallimastix sp. JGI-2020a]